MAVYLIQKEPDGEIGSVTNLDRMLGHPPTECDRQLANRSGWEVECRSSKVNWKGGTLQEDSGDSRVSRYVPEDTDCTRSEFVEFDHGCDLKRGRWR